MEEQYNVSPDNGLAMWVADMDFRPPDVIQNALRKVLNHGFYGYFGDDRKYREAIKWWMRTRHHWNIDPSWIFTTHGLVNGTALCIDSFTKPGDGIVLFTPIYHAFAKVIRAANRDVVECELDNNQGKYQLNMEASSAKLRGHEKMLIFCSPHNPGGRVWTRNELQSVIDFAKKNELILVSDEIHHDLVFPGHKHIPLALVDPTITDKLITMTATTKTFNIAGAHSGNVIIEDPILRKKFTKRMTALGLSPNSFGLFAATAAYSEQGANWVDNLVQYLDNNRKVFDEGINAIPGLKSMTLEATYLSWVDFSNISMNMPDVISRVERHAKIAINHGSTFGKGGENFLRFNIAMPRSQIHEAVDRMTKAFNNAN